MVLVWCARSLDEGRHLWATILMILKYPVVYIHNKLIVICTTLLNMNTNVNTFDVWRKSTNTTTWQCEKIVNSNYNFSAVSYFYTAECFHTLQICFCVYLYSGILVVIWCFVDKYTNFNCYYHITIIPNFYWQ